MTKTTDTQAERHIDAAITAKQSELFGDNNATANAELGSILAVITAAEERLSEAVAHHRRMGATWQEIADAMGISKQWAHERFGKTSTNTGAGEDEGMGTE